MISDFILEYDFCQVMIQADLFLKSALFLFPLANWFWLKIISF